MFNLPPNIVELHLHLNMDRAPCLEIEYIPDYTKPEIEYKKFEIKEIK